MNYKQAVVIGKFMPLHKGHIYLIEEAIKNSASVTVLVCTLQSEPIPGDLRYQWMKQTFPTQAKILHITEDLPSYPHQHPQFWQIWCRVIRDNTPKDLDVIFSSEEYGKTLGEKLNICHRDVDIQRKKVPIAAFKIRQKPFTNWDMISDAAKPYFVKKIALVGPESVGKTTLSQKLAAYFQTAWAHEYGREYNQIKPDLDVSDFEAIARGHIDLQNRQLRNCNKILICDTECIVTKVFLDLYFEKEAHLLADFFEEWIGRYARTYEMYLLIRPRDEGVDDGTRKHLHVREEHFHLLEAHLNRYKVPYSILQSDYHHNEQQAIKIVEEILQKY